jgi:hypothetical protein
VDGHAGAGGHDGADVLKRGWRKGDGAERGNLAGDAVVGEEIGAIWGDLDIENNIGGEKFREGMANGSIWREDQEAFVTFTKAEFLRAAHHSLAFDAAQFADFYIEIAGEDGAGKGDGDLVANAIIFRAANDLTWLAVASVHAADAEAVGIRVLGGFEDLADDDLRNVRAALMNLLDFDAGEGEEIDQFLRGGRKGDELAKPGEGGLHGRGEEIRNSKSEIRNGEIEAGAGDVSTRQPIGAIGAANTSNF